MFNKMEPPPLKAQCPALKLSGVNFGSIVVAPTYVTVNGLKYIESGTWIARVYFDACGKKVARRALLKAVGGPNHVVEPTSLLPGDFRGDLRLEADAKRIVLPGIMGEAHCGDWSTLYVLDIVSSDPPGSDKWREVWTAQACGTLVKSDVTYWRDDVRHGINISTTTHPNE
ncbi:MAG: hypothetical protein KGI68_12915 [Alphaproteobacteria bacterium]|nr:hypothetical protein [Alphaproteobacteria bacterium]MDE2163936.1 hypothetical protein [Alphaproteobacteria bacterium]